MKRFVFLSVVFSVISFCVQAQVNDLVIKKGNQGLYLDHKVAPREGLYAIGRLYNVNPKFIALYNNVSLDAGLAIGQVLHIPLTDTNFSQGSYAGTPVYYIAGSGDNLSRISNMSNNVTLQKLRDWNGLQNDNIAAGTKLIVGFLNSKEMAALAINNSVRKQTSPTENLNQTTRDPSIDNAVDNTDPAKSDESLTAENAVTQEKKNDTREVPAKIEPVAAVSKEMPSGQSPAEQGYFKTSFDLQVKRTPATKNATVTSAIFKTNSGWQDGKYYMLIDNVQTGTIVKLVNPDNNKAVFAKVLGEMKGIRQNEGLDIRISNAAAAALGVADTEKFILKINY